MNVGHCTRMTGLRHISSSFHLNFFLHRRGTTQSIAGDSQPNYLHIVTIFEFFFFFFLNMSVIRLLISTPKFSQKNGKHMKMEVFTG